MVKIVVAQNLNLTEEERVRLDALGDVLFYDDLAQTPDEWLERCR